MKYLKSVQIVNDDVNFIAFEKRGGTYEIVCPKCKNTVKVEYFYSKEHNLIPIYCCYCGKKWVKEDVIDNETQLRQLIRWQPIKNYQVGKHDWVLVQFEEKRTKFRCIPIVAEFRNGKWHTHSEDVKEETYLNECCKAIGFVDMQEQIMPLY